MFSEMKKRQELLGIIFLRSNFSQLQHGLLPTPLRRWCHFSRRLLLLCLDLQLLEKSWYTRAKTIDVDWKHYGPPYSENVPSHGREKMVRRVQE